MAEIFNTPYFGISLTILSFMIGQKIQKKTGLLICNPFLKHCLPPGGRFLLQFLTIIKSRNWRERNMAQLSTMSQVFDIISKKDGIIGIHARPGLGKTTLMLQIVDEVNKRKDGTALIFSLAESQAQLIRRMQQMNVSCERLVIDDAPHPTVEHMETRIKQVGKVSILCVDYLRLLENAVVEKLTEISKKYGVPILINGVLPREYGPKEKQEQCSALDYANRCPHPFPTYDFFAFIYRDTGPVAELIVKKCWDYDPVNIFMEWDDQETKFKF